MIRLAGWGIISGAALAIAVAAAPLDSDPVGSAPRAPQAVAPSPTAVPVEAARIVATHPHDSNAFTQGLFFADGALFESTGQHGESVIREVDLATGRAKREVRLPREYFGEGSTGWGDTIVSLTWKHRTGFRWDRRTLRQLGTFSYPGEGWGLTQDGKSLILSDGTAELRFLDPVTFTEQRRITVTYQGRPIRRLNELEMVRGEILANIWHQDLIVRIDPTSGVITGVIDLRDLVASVPVRDSESVLNGIAYDDKTGKLYVTGKNWPSLFEIALPSGM
ncbi:MULTISPECIES: glutaminyl-peptide cyclotransferase [unclassified Sphingomonas]|uniref:glutaminyl-peptide cyclotransferase n=1 Tax=unclassified Sphingomonas TaxID=196159 RepID=UPI0021506ED8|nr:MULTISPECIES: glutaminyl-peptide cyclotransferase [unclassified Sphingomonas]MCR5869883.1 glutaminyl-peptide cyclotransferase [Sphingomonas sp. J344]UUX98416.1 glutaminyl-peptide cyclotransferase [Sphingomonas sp. J315]